MADRAETTKQKLFIERYLTNGFNGVEAARFAGYGGDYDTLRSIASENLTKPIIKKRIAKRMAKTAMEADEVLSRLAMMARGDVSVFLTDGGRIDLTSDAAKRDSYLLKKVRVRCGKTKYGDPWTETEIELHDPQAALVQIGRHLALFTDKVAESVDKETREWITGLREKENAAPKS